MNKLIGGLVVQFQGFFKGLGPTKRMAVIAVFGIVLVSFFIMSVMISGKGYVPLLTHIPQDQISTIIAKLNEKNIPFQLKDGGETIAVPSDLLHSTQMTLMSEIGSSKMGSIGLEIFEKQDFTMNSYAQKINFQRALQGELMRAINTLTAVKQSKVILAIPNKKTFLEESTPPSASVVLELHQGKELTPEQVRGIRFLVANAVEGMDSDRVTVLDERGKVLTRQSDSNLSGTNDLLDLKEKIESDLENRIEQMLSKVVGHTKVIAKVDATLNHRVVTAIEETVDGEKTAILSQQSEEESLDGSRTNPSGIPGTRSNLPGAEDSSAVTGFKQDVKKEIKTTNFEVPKTRRNIQEGVGNIEKISVAVIVDGTTVIIKKEDGAEGTQWKPRTAEEIKKYEDLVKSAVGFSSSRGDTLKIENMPFEPEDFSESEKILTNIERKKLIHSLFKWLLLGFVMILFFFVVVRPFVQWITDSFQDSVDEMLPRTIEELEELQSVDNSLPGMNSVLPALSESIDPEKAESELLKDRIIGIMQKDEEKAANAFGMWLVRKDG